MSNRRTFTFRNSNRKPARLTFAVAGTTVAAAGLVAAGLATVTPGSPGPTTALGAVLAVHSSRDALPLTGISLDHVARGADRAAGRSPSVRPRHTGPCASSTLHWWICSAEHALEQHGVSRSLLSTGAADIVVRHESGANPHAYNGWDSNAAAGHPSEGIAQVIGPTFQAYALPGHHNIWNPVDNMIAAFRYAISRYGSMNNIPGVVAVRQGGSYLGY